MRRLPTIFLCLVLLCGCITPAEPAAEEPASEVPNETYEEPGEPPEEPFELPLEPGPVEIPGLFNETDGPGQSPNGELVRSVLDSYDENDSSSFDNVNLLLVTEVEDMLPLLDENDTLAQWTALYVLSNIAYDADEETKAEVKEKLRPFLDGKQISFRLMAAITLVTMGDKDGVPVLIELLGDENYLMLSEPPALICQYSNYMLTRYTGADFDFHCFPGDIDLESQARWESWWAVNGDRLVWDEADGKLVVS